MRRGRPAITPADDRIRIARSVRKSRKERFATKRLHDKEQADIKGMDKVLRELGNWHKPVMH